MLSINTLQLLPAQIAPAWHLPPMRLRILQMHRPRPHTNLTLLLLSMPHNRARPLPRRRLPLLHVPPTSIPAAYNETMVASHQRRPRPTLLTTLLHQPALRAQRTARSDRASVAIRLAGAGERTARWLRQKGVSFRPHLQFDPRFREPLSCSGRCRNTHWVAAGLRRPWLRGASRLPLRRVD